MFYKYTYIMKQKIYIMLIIIYHEMKPAFRRKKGQIPDPAIRIPPTQALYNWVLGSKKILGAKKNGAGAWRPLRTHYREGAGRIQEILRAGDMGRKWEHAGQTLVIKKTNLGKWQGMDPPPPSPSRCVPPASRYLF